MSLSSFDPPGARRPFGSVIATALASVGCLIAGAHPASATAAVGPGAVTAQHDDVRVWQSLRYAWTRRATVDVYRPARRGGRLPGVLVVHGGAWTHGDKAKMREVSTRLASSGLIAYSVNYALARSGSPGLPIQLRQLRSAVRWMRGTSDRFGLAPRRIGALGTSAGGHLVSLLSNSGRGPLDKGERVRAVAAWSAPHDLNRLAGASIARSITTLIGCAPCPGRWTAASPITHVSNDDPPMLIFNSLDEQIPASQARLMSDRLASAGVPHGLRLLDGSVHALRYSDRALGRTTRFLRRHLS